MRYLVWAMDYSHASSGPKALHYLVRALNAAGERAEVGNGFRGNPEWDEPQGRPAGDYCAVYPEIVAGNPWRAPRVARWALNVPGAIGGDREFDPSEAVFAWDPAFLAGAPVLRAPHIETSIHFDRGLRRSGELFYTGKGRAGDTAGASEVTLALREDRHALALALNRAALLRCFDPLTAMADIALLNGCPVLMPDGRVLSPDGAREREAAHAAAWPGQLRRFVETTQ